MLTVSFVLMGTLLIQGSFMRAADMFGRYSHTLMAMAWTHREDARVREELLYSDGAGADSQSGTLQLSDGKTCQWSREVQSSSGPGLYSIRTEVHWTESGRPVDLQSEFYVYKKSIPQGA